MNEFAVETYIIIDPGNINAPVRKPMKFSGFPVP